MNPTTAWIGLGSNLGDRRKILDTALRAIGDLPGTRLIGCSAIVATDPVGGPPGQETFLNAAAGLVTTLAPCDLLAGLQAIEAAAGRHRVVRWGERTLDLDLLLYGSTVQATPTLTLPHPRLAVRRFVLAPLAEIAPEVVHPPTGQTIARLLDRIDRRPGLLALAGPEHPLKDRLADFLRRSFDGPEASRAGDPDPVDFGGAWRLFRSDPEPAPGVALVRTTEPTFAVVIDPDARWRPPTPPPPWPLIWPESLEWTPLLAEIAAMLLAAQPG